MIYNGKKYRINKNIVFFEPCACGREHQLGFGRICSVSDDGAVASFLKYTQSGQTVYAIPIACNGHSLTNSMYGVDGREYLALDGRVYTRKLHQCKII